jgi:hypothetical protein
MELENMIKENLGYTCGRIRMLEGNEVSIFRKPIHYYKDD